MATWLGRVHIRVDSDSASFIVTRISSITPTWGSCCASVVAVAAINMLRMNSIFMRILLGSRHIRSNVVAVRGVARQTAASTCVGLEQGTQKPGIAHAGGKHKEIPFGEQSELTMTAKRRLDLLL